MHTRPHKATIAHYFGVHKAKSVVKQSIIHNVKMSKTNYSSGRHLYNVPGQNFLAALKSLHAGLYFTTPVNK